MEEEHAVIPTAGTAVDADLGWPDIACGVVLFAHGSGSSRYSPRNRVVAAALQRDGYVTVVADLLTADEERAERRGGRLRFDIGLLADRLTGIVDWLAVQPRTRRLPLGLFGASTGAAAALVTAARRASLVRAVVSRGGRCDLAGEALAQVHAPTLLIVGDADRPVVTLNQQAAAAMAAVHRLHLVPGATHLFEEPGALEEVIGQTAGWFAAYLTQPATEVGGAATGTDLDGYLPGETPAGTPVVFGDRSEAGLALADHVADSLRRYGGAERPLILALPRGGVPVGAEVARVVGGELDVIVARKVGTPRYPEFGIGAVTVEGPTVLDRDTLRRLGLTVDDLRPAIAGERAEARRRLRSYRGNRPGPRIAGRVVVVVDDGLATGVTARAALRAVRDERPRHLAFAAPVCAPDAADVLAAETDEVICVRQPPDFRAVGVWYRDFGQLDDDEVREILNRSGHRGTCRSDTGP